MRKIVSRRRIHSLPPENTPPVEVAAAVDLVHSEKRYRRLFETARDGILLLEIDTGAITDANPFMTELLGYTREELLGQELWQLGLFADQAASQAAFEQLQEQKYIRYDGLPLQSRQGQRREVEFVSNVYRENGVVVIQCNIRDITERKRIAAELQATSLALEAALTREQQITGMLQRPMLFQPPEDAFSGLTVQTAYAMASDEALVGGDFWDTFAFDNGHVALVLGDVMGHGLTSAIFTTELKHTMRAYIREHEQPGRILFHMNQFLYQSNRLFHEGINAEGTDAPVCLTLAAIERQTGAGTLSIAGMEAPLIVRANGECKQMIATGMPLGVFAGIEYHQVDFKLEAGDTLLLFTDGITEARQGQNFLDVEGLTRLAVAGIGSSLKEMSNAIMNGARDFAGGKLRDDASLILVRRNDTSPPVEKEPAASQEGHDSGSPDPSSWDKVVQLQPASPANTRPLPLSRGEALALYRANERYASVAVNVFVQKYPSALSGTRQKDDLLSDAMLILWHCCERYDASKAVPVSVFALKSILWKLFERWRQSTLRVENGQKVSIPSPVSLSTPLVEGGSITLADGFPAEAGGGRWGSDGLSAVLHQERIENARAAWESKAPWLRAKCPSMAAEMEAVLNNQR